MRSIGIRILPIAPGLRSSIFKARSRPPLNTWFGSTLITSMFVAAIVCLVLAVWWELRVPDPVVELGLP